MKFASRKFIVAMVLIACTTWLAGTGRLDGNNTMVIFAIVGGGYGFANVIDKKKGRGRVRGKPTASSLKLPASRFLLAAFCLCLLPACAPMGSVRVERRITHPDGTLEVISSRLVAPKYPLEGSYIFTTTNSVEAWISSSQDASRIEKAKGASTGKLVIYGGLALMMVLGAVALALPNAIVSNKDALLIISAGLIGFLVVRFVEASERIMGFVIPGLVIAGAAYLFWLWKRGVYRL